MTPEQLREIESEWAYPKMFGLRTGVNKTITSLLAEVRRLNRMVDKGVDYLEHSCCDAPQSFDCEEINRDCRDCWKEYLESEVAGNG